MPRTPGTAGHPPRLKPAHQHLHRSGAAQRADASAKEVAKHCAGCASPSSSTRKKRDEDPRSPATPPGKPSQPGHTLTVVHRVAERARADHALGFVCQGEGAAHLGGAVQLKGGVVGGDAVGAGDPRGGGGSGAHCKEKEGERQGQSGDRGGEEGLGAGSVEGGMGKGSRDRGPKAEAREES